MRMHRFREETRSKHREMAQQQHEQLKIVENLSKSAMDSNKFKINPEYKARKKHVVDDQDNKRSKNYEKPYINLKMDTEISSSLIPEKFEIEGIYNVLPFKK